jgi:hypothetical protein
MASEIQIKFPLKIINIHRGEGDRACYIYAELRDDADQLLISAILPYIMDRIPTILGTQPD